MNGQTWFCIEPLSNCFYPMKFVDARNSVRQQCRTQVTTSGPQSILNSWTTWRICIRWISEPLGLLTLTEPATILDVKLSAGQNNTFSKLTERIVASISDLA
jgi:hypothetical protein